MNRIERILYNSGDIFLPKPIKQLLEKVLVGSLEKTFYISGWSIIHFIAGIVVGYIYLYLGYNRSPSMYYYKMFVFHTITELWQMLIGMSKPYNITGHNNAVDTIFDTIYFMMGAYIVRVNS